MSKKHIKTVTFFGVETKDVEIQSHIGSGVPSLILVGLADKAIAESKERIRVAINSLGFSLPPKRIVVNLAPADLKKEGSHFDLPIALSILMSMGIINEDALENIIALGELSLDGKIGNVKGILPAAMHSIDKDCKIIIPKESIVQCGMIAKNLDFIATENLVELVSILSGKNEYKKPDVSTIESNEDLLQNCPDMSSIRGQDIAKRGMIIAACGGHNVLLNGHPGTGKSMLASSFPTILPRLTSKEAVEVSMIYSLSGLLKKSSIGLNRPYRSPHHSASMASIVGGGKFSSLGEITLSHRGVLFLDELPEFQRQVLDSLRQPLESGSVTV